MASKDEIHKIWAPPGGMGHLGSNQYCFRLLTLFTMCLLPVRLFFKKNGCPRPAQQRLLLTFRKRQAFFGVCEWRNSGIGRCLSITRCRLQSALSWEIRVRG